MHVYGTPGSTLGDDAAFTTKARARQGRRGESDCATLIHNAFRHDDDAYVFHDVSIPGMRANIDHVVVRGLNVLAVDAKRWKAGLYWTLLGHTRRGREAVPHCDKATIPAAQRILREFLEGGSADYPELAQVSVRGALIVFPTGNGRMSLLGYRSPGGVPARVAATSTQRWLRRQVAGRHSAPSGPLLRALHNLTDDKQTVRVES